ncbi:uncharacterized protein SPPG_03062 [Spizellomyces punctatus DAOM BR117]|uniref:holo-[acyl-carrier-protein] synthase n=1 Tax=Spizellomyces punctatus (strain DAOM BR117) TaxID=645134 RepID=A0A0L0HJP1_SPIPD|nr:uncharacterized protein SPPG_03062 [Spizellomyces punctatus DAOM BR117]KND01248.1 hypothetical protein SPPG_03062 [Spizellomyces punctatus DAOM BR117]|eukprot:XP_016609287.1 hypothetical protein SPPG_03062 [Spizellomyces punctatus DAOM BR117]
MVTERQDQLLRLLPPAEQERVKRYRFRIDACRALIGQLLARTAVIALLASQDSFPDLSLHSCWYDIDISRDAHEKPFLFNVSHHGDWVVIAAGFSKQLGVDVSSVDNPSDEPVDEYLADFDEVFTEAEWAYIHGSRSHHDGDGRLDSSAGLRETLPKCSETCRTSSCSGRADICAPDINPILQGERLTQEQQKLHRFAQLWALKESYVKAIGVGLALDLRRVEFRFEQAQSPLMELQETVHLPSSIRVALDTVVQAQIDFDLRYLDSRHPVACCVMSACSNTPWSTSFEATTSYPPATSSTSQPPADDVPKQEKETRGTDQVAGTRFQAPFRCITWNELYTRIVAAGGRIYAS